MESQSDCPFCRICSGEATAVLLFENDETLAFMDIRPAAEGHSLVIPRAHFFDVLDLPEALARTCAAATQRLAAAIQRALSPDGIRINQYNGRAAGQTVFHYHLHVVPVMTGRKPPSHGRDVADATHLERVATRIRQNL